MRRGEARLLGMRRGKARLLGMGKGEARLLGMGKGEARLLGNRGQQWNATMTSHDKKQTHKSIMTTREDKGYRNTDILIIIYCID